MRRLRGLRRLRYPRQFVQASLAATPTSFSNPRVRLSSSEIRVKCMFPRALAESFDALSPDDRQPVLERMVEALQQFSENPDDDEDDDCVCVRTAAVSGLQKVREMLSEASFHLKGFRQTSVAVESMLVAMKSEKRFSSVMEQADRLCLELQNLVSHCHSLGRFYDTVDRNSRNKSDRMRGMTSRVSTTKQYFDSRREQHRRLLSLTKKERSFLQAFIETLRNLRGREKGSCFFEAKRLVDLISSIENKPAAQKFSRQFVDGLLAELEKRMRDCSADSVLLQCGFDCVELQDAGTIRSVFAEEKTRRTFTHLSTLDPLSLFEKFVGPPDKLTPEETAIYRRLVLTGDESRNQSCLRDILQRRTLVPHLPIDAFGNNALHYACFFECETIARILLQASNPNKLNVANRDGWRPPEFLTVVSSPFTSLFFEVALIEVVDEFRALEMGGSQPDRDQVEIVQEYRSKWSSGKKKKRGLFRKKNCKTLHYRGGVGEDDLPRGRGMIFFPFDYWII